jgi:hypothetical protein
MCQTQPHDRQVSAKHAMCFLSRVGAHPLLRRAGSHSRQVPLATNLRRGCERVAGDARGPLPRAPTIDRSALTHAGLQTRQAQLVRYAGSSVATDAPDGWMACASEQATLQALAGLNGTRTAAAAKSQFRVSQKAGLPVSVSMAIVQAPPDFGLPRQCDKPYAVPFKLLVRSATREVGGGGSNEDVPSAWPCAPAAAQPLTARERVRR